MTLSLSLILALVAGLADVVGGFLTLSGRRGPLISLHHTTGLAAGFIVAAALLDRVPEAVTVTNPRGAWLILVGFLAIYLVENLFSTHAHLHEDEDHVVDPRAGEHGHGHALVSEFQPEECLISPAASNAALVGLLLHTLFDGVAIAAGFMASPHTGAIMFLAVIFHKMPEGFSVAALMLAAGRGSRFALLASGMLGVSTFLGAVLVTALVHTQAAVAQQTWAQAMLSLATGTFLYIGCSDMIPATNQGGDRRAVAMVVLGVLLFVGASVALQMLGLKESI